MTITPANALHGHTDEESAYLVDDYPYGFRLRTSIRYWIETTKHGDRMCSQTLNPKTDRWNKPKRSTYAPVGCLYLDDEQHVQWTAIQQHTEEPFWSTFLDIMAGHLNDGEKNQVAQIIGLRAAFEPVTFEVVEGRRTPEEEAEQERIHGAINRHAARVANKARSEM